jgi:Tfp pilus assembly protein PilV
MNNPIHHHAAHRRGSSLVEVLVAFLVVSLGILAAARVQNTLRQGAELARQRSEAVRLAQQEIEALRAFAVQSAGSGLPAFADIASRSVADDSGIDATTRFTLTRQVRSAAGLPAKLIEVHVDWADTAGEAQRVRLDTVIAGTEPALSGSLALPPGGSPVNGPQARAVHIPGAAVDFGNGSSGLLLSGGADAGSLGGATALVFDNASGALTARCTTAATANLRLADLGPCDRAPGLLVSGHLRFDGRATALPFGLQLALSDATEATPPWCGHGAPTLEGGTAYVAFHCVVHPPAGRSGWSGRLDIVPVHWTLGSDAGSYRVCRTSVDLDGSGSIDTNLEHPVSYTDVRSALTHQNFSVVEGTQNCGVGAVPHQP